jgi:hypothetical protein
VGLLPTPTSGRSRVDKRPSREAAAVPGVAERRQVLNQFALPGSRLKLGRGMLYQALPVNAHAPFPVHDIVARGGFNAFEYAVRTDPRTSRTLRTAAGIE